MKRYPLLFSIIGLQSLLFFFPAAFTQDQNSSPLMMRIGERGKSKGSSSTPRGHENLQNSNEDNNNSSLAQRRMLDHGEPREIISEEESLNKIESLADQFEQDHLQMILEIIENRLATHPTGLVGLPLESAKALIEEAKVHQQRLIEQKAAYVQAIRPPYEQGNAQTQATIKEIALNYRIEQNLRSKKKQEALDIILDNKTVAQKYCRQQAFKASQGAKKEKQQPQSRKQVIDLFDQVADRYSQALTTYAAKNLVCPRKAPCLAKSAEALDQAVKEAQEPQPREQAIKLYIQSADRYNQSAAACIEISVFKLFKFSTKEYLEASAKDLGQAAKEAQQLQAREQVIKLLTQKADYYEKAAALEAAGNSEEAERFTRPINALSRAVREAQQRQPREEVIDLFTQSADFDDQARAASDPFAAGCLMNSASALYQIGGEVIRNPQLRKQVIYLFTQVADRYKQAAEAAAAGDPVKAGDLKDSADDLEIAATQELWHPHEKEFIELYFKKAAEKYEKAIRPSSCTIS